MPTTTGRSSRTVIRNLITCARDGGNYLLNIGPQPDGSIPEESVQILTEVGQLDGDQRRDDLQVRHLPGRAAPTTPVSPARATRFTCTSISGRASDVAITGLKVKVKSAHLLKTKAELKFTQDEYQTKFTGLPQSAPDSPVTTIAIECDGEPTQDTDFVRKNKPRDGV